MICYHRPLDVLWINSAPLYSKSMRMFTAHHLSPFKPRPISLIAMALLGLLGSPAAVQADADDAALLAAEARDAAVREQRELQDRAEDLARQLEEARKLQALQDVYLEKLAAELEALELRQGQDRNGQDRDVQGAPHAD